MKRIVNIFWSILTDDDISHFVQESFDGQMTENNIEIGICNAEGFSKLPPATVKDYLAAIM